MKSWVDAKDQKVVNSIVAGDKMNAVVIEGDYSALAEQYKEQLETWNKSLRMKGKY